MAYIFLYENKTLQSHYMLQSHSQLISTCTKLRFDSFVCMMRADLAFA